MNAKILISAVGLAGVASVLGATVEVPADTSETLGMIKISKANVVNSEIVLGAPFMKSPAGDTNTVNSLLVAGYGADLVNYKGDTVHVWDPEKPSSRGYNAWVTWPDDDGSNMWIPVNDGVEDPPAASDYAVNRGTAFWFVDVSGDTNDLVHAGLVKPGAQSFVAAGSTTNLVKTLLINPYYTAINAVEALSTGAVTGDQLALVGGTSRYEYKEGEEGGWGTWQKTIKKKIGSIIIYGPDKFVPTNNIPVPAGKAFWYISKGGSPTVSWDDL